MPLDSKIPAHLLRISNQLSKCKEVNLIPYRISLAPSLSETVALPELTCFDPFSDPEPGIRQWNWYPYVGNVLPKLPANTPKNGLTGLFVMPNRRS